mmetsp:Transcript_17807/g.26340  ORF Transcript_17807/g.26340 Transcript_17807/m.26340 type:complete len:369 (-) Transcript_17807:595-1701(-)|eukprot:CAMPEP_0194063036 /NCGR_PEP_ID=MMETSP0009_2-20130614/79228_1 /TAXON_ID=210454 /ORGANISM="Grammatophora oceanica, Strain CCMP 410" /LENGTH=368 /DNA_ID=CAMNT_0038714999 /DNA_START=40 /DNA_END=1146 /DNA_ORIENTATION=-
MKMSRLFSLLLICFVVLAPEYVATFSPIPCFYTCCQDSSLYLSRDFDADSSLDNGVHSRRSILAASAGVVASSLLPFHGSAEAAGPVSPGEADGLGPRVERFLRKKPQQTLRQKLDLKFAVLLMRSSYNALDQIDVVPMDQFQRDFFLIRQAEYQPYLNNFGPGMVSQGDLTDPNYFDFISFAQYATISRAIHKSPSKMFVEQQPENYDPSDDKPTVFVKRVVQRTLPDDQLEIEHDRLVGKAILDRLDETFGSTPGGLPKFEDLFVRPSSAALLRSFQQLVKLFLVNGYAWDGDVVISSQQPLEFCFSLTTPCTLWSGQALQQRGASPNNGFVLKAATEYAREAGYQVPRSRLKYEGNVEKAFLTLL